MPAPPSPSPKRTMLLRQFFGRLDYETLRESSPRRNSIFLPAALAVAAIVITTMGLSLACLFAAMAGFQTAWYLQMFHIDQDGPIWNAPMVAQVGEWFVLGLSLIVLTVVSAPGFVGLVCAVTAAAIGFFFTEIAFARGVYRKNEQEMR